MVFDVLSVAKDPAGPSALIGATVTIPSNPQYGTVTVDPNTQHISYQANAGFTGFDVIRYTISDANGASAQVATLTVNILTPMNALMG